MSLKYLKGNKTNHTVHQNAMSFWDRHDMIASNRYMAMFGTPSWDFFSNFILGSCIREIKTYINRLYMDFYWSCIHKFPKLEVTKHLLVGC
jgi:hypothetical protein